MNKVKVFKIGLVLIVIFLSLFLYSFVMKHSQDEYVYSREDISVYEFIINKDKFNNKTISASGYLAPASLDDFPENMPSCLFATSDDAKIENVFACIPITYKLSALSKKCSNIFVNITGPIGIVLKSEPRDILGFTDIKVMQVINPKELIQDIDKRQQSEEFCNKPISGHTRINLQAK